jgi:hypothetical protein
VVPSSRAAAPEQDLGLFYPPAADGGGGRRGGSGSQYPSVGDRDASQAAGVGAEDELAEGSQDSTREESMELVAAKLADQLVEAFCATARTAAAAMSLGVYSVASSIAKPLASVA